MEGVDHHADERNKAEFDVEEMKIVWAGSRQAFEVSDRIARLVASDPVNFSQILVVFCSLILLISRNFDLGMCWICCVGLREKQ